MNANLQTPLNGAPASDVAAEAQEKKALCVSIASLLLSIPALIGA